MIKKIYYFAKHRLFGNKNFQKFIIVSRPRSGSEWLVSLLNSHPNCITRGEIFRHSTGKLASKMFNKQFSRNWNKNIDSVGFKIFYHHPLGSNDLTVWKLIKEDSSIKIVELIRRNWLRIFISEEIGKFNNQWILKEEVHKKFSKIKIDIYQLNKFLNNNKKLSSIEQYRTLQDTHSIYKIYYEDLVNNTDEEIEKLLKYLGLKTKKLKSFLQKQNPEPIKSLILNYNELEDFLKRTEYEIFLND